MLFLRAAGIRAFADMRAEENFRPVEIIGWGGISSHIFGARKVGGAEESARFEAEGNAPPYRNFARLRRRPNHSKIRFITAATAAKNGRERAIALFNCLTKFSIRKLDIFKNRFHKY